MARRLTKTKVNQLYFDWLCRLINTPDDRVSRDVRVLKYLYSKDFRYSNDMDANRAADGVDMRYNFSYDTGYSFPDVREALLDKPCSCLEMMVALAWRCENNIMGDYDKGDRTPIWFWVMIDNLGVSSDQLSDIDICDDIIEHWFVCDYGRDGAHSLWYVPGVRKDMRKREIWSQMMIYLDAYYGEEFHLDRR